MSVQLKEGGSCEEAEAVPIDGLQTELGNTGGSVKVLFIP